jgi:hypothetical protein
MSLNQLSVHFDEQELLRTRICQIKHDLANIDPSIELNDELVLDILICLSHNDKNLLLMSPQESMNKEICKIVEFVSFITHV